MQLCMRRSDVPAVTHTKRDVEEALLEVRLSSLISSEANIRSRNTAFTLQSSPLSEYVSKVLLIVSRPTSRFAGSLITPAFHVHDANLNPIAEHSPPAPDKPSHDLASLATHLESQC